MIIFLTTPSLKSRDHRVKYIPDTLIRLTSHTDFYVSKLFGPDADLAATSIGLRKGLKSKDGFWVVPSKNKHKQLLKLGAKQFTDSQLTALSPKELDE
jgi:hypothetical protein